MIDPKLSMDQRMARKRELVSLLRLMGFRVSPAVREQLLTMLATVEPRWRAQVADAIGSLEGDAETAHALVEMLKATPDDIYTRQAIFGALGMMNVQEVTPALFSLIGEALPDEHMVIKTLGQLATPEQLDQLFGLLDRPLRAQSRTEIENVLRDNARYPAFLDKVAAALDDADTAKRCSLLRILAVSTSPAHAEKVRALLETETDEKTRATAISALGRYGDLESGRALLKIAQASPTGEQQRAIQAIFSITNPDTIDALAESYGQLGTDGRHALMGAMVRLPNPTEKMITLAREEGLVDGEMRVRSQAARVLGRRGRDDNVQALTDFLRRSRHPQEVGAALNSLQEIRTAKAAEAAISALGAVPNERQRELWRERFLKMAEEVQPVTDVR
jgi:HEAT repeat protein